MQASKLKLAVLAFSGGLDTSFAAVWLREQGYEVVTVTVDTGGFNATITAQIAARAEELGVTRHLCVDARTELFDRYLRYLLFANARRGAGYPLCVSAERVCQAVKVAETALELGADALCHGSTGAGNDQVRFDIAFSVLAPQLELLTPIRSLGLSRSAETQFLEERGYSVPAHTATYSVNSGMWGTTIGGRETHDSWQTLAPEAWPGHSTPASSPDVVTLTFGKGVPTALNGNSLTPVEIVTQLAETGGRHRIGEGIHLGDTILGIKGRVGYSAPAAQILIEAHRELEKLTLSARQLFWKETLGNLYCSLVHEAQYFDPLCRDLEALLESSQECVTGTVRVRLRAGQVLVEGCESPYSLLALQDSAYGEQSAWSGSEAAAFCRVYGNQQRLCQLQHEAATREAAK